MIGLESGCVRFEESHNEWADEFLRIREELAPDVLGWAEIEHVGSTAVRGLRAKPIVDVALGWLAADHKDELLRVLRQHGYRYRGFRDDAGGDIADYVVGGLTTRHVHVVEFGSRQWERYLVFRNHLRRSAEARAEYEQFKIALAERFAVNRRAYTATKREYIERVMTGALEVARSHQRGPD